MLKLLTYLPMRKICFILMLCSFQISAQKRDESNVYFRFKTSPFINLPEDIRTYYVSLETPFDLYDKPKNSSKEDHLNFNNEQRRILARDSVKLEENRFSYAVENPNLTIQITTSNFTIDSITPADISKMNMLDIIAKVSFNSTIKVFTSQKVYLDTIITLPEKARIIKKAYLLSNLPSKIAFHKENLSQEVKKALLEEYIFAVRRNYLISNLENVSKIVNDYFSKRTLYLRAFISGGKGKEDYTELNDLNEDISKKFIKLDALSDKNKTPADVMNTSLDKAIEIWNKELATANPSDEKARINKKIMDGLNMNLALAYIYKRDIKKSFYYLDQVPESIPVEEGTWSSVMYGTFKDKALQLRKILDMLKGKDTHIIL